MTVSETIESVGAGNILAITILVGAFLLQHNSFQTHIEDFEKTTIKRIEKLEADNRTLIRLEFQVAQIDKHITSLDGKMDMVLSHLIKD